MTDSSHPAPPRSSMYWKLVAEAAEQRAAHWDAVLLEKANRHQAERDVAEAKLAHVRELANEWEKFAPLYAAAILKALS